MPDVLQLIQVPPMLLHTIRYKSSSSVCARICNMLCTRKTCILSTNFATAVEGPMFTTKFYSWSTHAALGLISPTSTANISCLIKSSCVGSVSPTATAVPHQLWAWILGDYLKDPVIYRQVLVATSIFILLRIQLNYWKVGASVRVFTCGFNTTVLRHVTALKYTMALRKLSWHRIGHWAGIKVFWPAR